MITNDWLPVLKSEFGKPYYKKLYQTVGQEYRTQTVYPPGQEIFSAFDFTPYEKVKVVILGQDPYHEPGQAHGLSFSVKPGLEIPPSLQNIYKELQTEYGCRIPNNGYLKYWAEQGVLMLNTILTVRAHRALSHQGIGWEEFTDAAIREINRIDRPVVFMLWGAPAGKKAVMLNNQRHLVLRAPHPSPLSAYRGFFGCGHFRKCNHFLVQNGQTPIDWQIPDI